jgi:hypothetical protein
MQAFPQKKIPDSRKGIATESLGKESPGSALEVKPRDKIIG